MKRKTDYELIQQLREEGSAALGNRGGISGFINSLFNYFLRSIPFSVKVFLRKDMGSMTYSWATIIFAAIWARFILDGYLDPHEFAPPDLMFNACPKGSEYYWLVYPFWLLAMVIIQFGYVVINFIPHELYQDGAANAFHWKEHIPFLFSVLIILLGWLHKSRIAHFHKKRRVFDPLHEGDSLIRLGTAWVFDLFGKGTFDKVFKDSDDFHKGWEFLIPMILAFVSLCFTESIPSMGNFFWFFLIGAFAIPLEEMKIEQQRRRDVEARFATEFLAAKIEARYQEFKQSEKDEPATVSYVSVVERHFLPKPQRNTKVDGATVSYTANHY